MMFADRLAAATLRPWFAWRPVRLGYVGTKWAWWRWVERTDIHGFALYCERGTRQRIAKLEKGFGHRDLE